ncbi:hypothetical protein BGZ61DRAFT_472164 [Ilyonectria robusta]|uniref:uncharacterized protein n=1 Tax=Ilyonectria robusta TaxID=1079257 RepID=UPI001E8E746D|nr:uncharacterized protein BGZ61DRAFT_472164 [Ilyonectria robusta]KAH8735765.1 hypothetical protein BGZ61DRAFT_472164 [Ilyonectria robusta]
MPDVVLSTIPTTTTTPTTTTPIHYQPTYPHQQLVGALIRRRRNRYMHDRQPSNSPATGCFHSRNFTTIAAQAMKSLISPIPPTSRFSSVDKTPLPSQYINAWLAGINSLATAACPIPSSRAVSLKACGPPARSGPAPTDDLID